MATKRTSASDKAHAMIYKTQQIWSKNRKLKLERALKRNPENTQISEALKNIQYRRKTPSTQEWSASSKAMAQLVKLFTGFCDKNIFHANKDLREAAYQAIKAKQPKIEHSLSQNTKGMFSIKARAHFKGEPVWA